MWNYSAVQRWQFSNNIDWIFKNDFGKLCAFCGDRTSGSLYKPRKCYRIELLDRRESDSSLSMVQERLSYFQRSDHHLKGNTIFLSYVRDAFRVKPKLIYWQISSAVPQHSGRYRCLATNSEGKTLTREAFVEVRLPPTSQRLRAAFFDVPTQHSGKKRISSLFFFRNWITTLCFSYDVRM
jgi:hypothetical protein